MIGKDVEVYYALPAKEESFNVKWVTRHEVLVPETLKGWWEDSENFKVKNDQEYKIDGLRKVYRLVAAMMCGMYSREDATTFNGAWVPLMYAITPYATRFN